jgi:hypothetical protein
MFTDFFLKYINMIIQFTHELKAEVSNPDEEGGFLMAIKIRSTFFFFGGKYNRRSRVVRR